MTVAVIKAVVLVVTHFDQPVFHAKGIAIIITRFMVMDLYDPVIKVFAIEQRYPFFFSRIACIFLNGTGTIQ